MRAEFARRKQASSQDSGAVSAASSSPCSSPSGDNEDEDNNSTEGEEDMEECTVEASNEDIIADLSAVDNEELENEVDPIEELVDDLVQEIEAVTSAEAAEHDVDGTADDRSFEGNVAT